MVIYGQLINGFDLTHGAAFIVAYTHYKVPRYLQERRCRNTSGCIDQYMQNVKNVKQPGLRNSIGIYSLVEDGNRGRVGTVKRPRYSWLLCIYTRGLFSLVMKHHTHTPHLSGTMTNKSELSMLIAWGEGNCDHQLRF